MIKAGVRVLTVDNDMRNWDRADYFLSTGTGTCGKCTPVSPTYAYSELIASLPAGEPTVGVDLEGTSAHQTKINGVALMVQTASFSVVVIEYPRGKCSENWKNC